MARTAIDPKNIPTFEGFSLHAESDDFLTILDDRGILQGTVRRFAKYRGKVSNQWTITGLGDERSIYDFEQIEAKFREFGPQVDEDFDDEDYDYED